jgi:hypothetical protein
MTLTEFDALRPKQQKLTAFRDLKSAGILITYDRDFEEYRVNVRPDREATAYYTSDLWDAYQTGLAMSVPVPARN